MKIAVLSPNRNHLHEIGAVLEHRAHTAVLLEGGKSRMREVADQEKPDMMLVDGICCDPGELAHVEAVTAHHPGVAVVLLCPSHTSDFLLQAMRAGVREVLPSPPARDALVASVERVAAKLKGAAGPRGKLLAFTSCKGGSGATFLATNLGWQLAETSNVLLVDLNLQFGDALSFVHDGRPPLTLADVAKEIGRLDASLLAASTVRVAPSFSLLPAPDDLSRAMEIQAEHVEAILDVAMFEYDFVVADVGRNIDPIAIKAFDRAWRIYPVMQSQLPDLRNAGRLLEAFRALGYPSDRAELIVNRFERNAEIGLDQIQRSFAGVRVHTVPNSFRDVSSSINHGEPLARADRANPVARHLADFARALSPRQDESRGLLGRLFKRA